MIKKFDDFFDKSNQEIFENVNAGVLDDTVTLDSIDQEDAQDFVEPDMVSDDRYLSKISNIVLKHLKKRITSKFLVHPFVLNIDDKKCAMIYNTNSYMILFKNGIEKEIVYFKSNPLLNGETKSEFSVSTRKLGFLAMIRSLVDLVSMNTSAVNEVRSTPEIGPATKPISGLATVAKKCADSLDDSVMAEFLKYYEKYDDNEIVKIMMESAEDDLTENLIEVRKVLCMNKTGTEVQETAARRAIQAVHMILCGNTWGCDPKQIAAMKNCWFFGAGQSGSLAIFIGPDGRYHVRESSDVMESKVNELQKKMDSVYNAAESICKYIKSGGRDFSMRKYIAKHRGMLITGVAGIGKSVSLNKAIAKVGLKENVDYKKFGNSTTGANEVYNQLYEGNNMLLIYDDTPDMFDTPLKISLWKLAMEGDEPNRLVVNPSGEAKKNSNIFYNASDPEMTRQDMYHKEIGKFTDYEKEAWLKKEEKRLKAEYTAKRGRKTTEDEYSYMDSDAIDKAVKDRALYNFKEYEENESHTLIPDRFIFNGFIVYISNNSLDTFRKSIRDHWDAISSRMTVIDISPTRKVIWAWLRKKILADAEDTTIKDEFRILPSESKVPLNEVLEYMDDIMEGKFNDDINIYGKINFRIVSNIRDYIYFDNPNWKEAILGEMLLSGAREI